VDCHAHVFGPFREFPLAHDRPYTPAELPGERHRAMLDQVGMTRGVLVQAVAHGTDCGALLNALARDPERLRGVALLTPDVTDAQLQKMHQRGVRAARFFSRPVPGPGDAVSLKILESLAPRLAQLGWHAEISARCDEIETIVARLQPLGLHVVIDHMGHFEVGDGVAHHNFQTLLRLIATSQNLWLKLIPYRLSRDYPDYEDIEPFHRALLAANPERLVWGSDWPHVHMTRNMPDDGHLLDLFEHWTPDERLRRQILVHNPERLYGF
jgi:predicted TIM-barrel fold metal-dependent hydrolase